MLSTSPPTSQRNPVQSFQFIAEPSPAQPPTLVPPPKSALTATFVPTSSKDTSLFKSLTCSSSDDPVVQSSDADDPLVNALEFSAAPGINHEPLHDFALIKIESFGKSIH